MYIKNKRKRKIKKGKEAEKIRRGKNSPTEIRINGLQYLSD